MNKLITALSLSLSGVFLSSLYAQTEITVTTDAVGVMKTTVSSSSDVRLGVPLTQAPLFEGKVSSVSGSVVSFGVSLPSFGGQGVYLKVSSDSSSPNGGIEGKWFTIEDSSSSSITVAENLASFGLESGDSVQVVPFWTLDTLFPEGGQFPKTSDVFSPNSFLILSDVLYQGINPGSGGLFIYHDGSQGDAGWYNADDLGAGLVGDTVVSPESFVTARNGSSEAVALTIAGSVPSSQVQSDIVSRSAGRQDNLVYNPYPKEVSLANSNLVSSGAFSPSSDVFLPTDILYVYETTISGFNPAPTKSLIYHDGSQGAAGWYDLDDLAAGTVDSFELEPGVALVIRRGQGSDSVVSWNPPLPYEL